MTGYKVRHNICKRTRGRSQSRSRERLRTNKVPMQGAANLKTMLADSRIKKCCLSNPRGRKEGILDSSVKVGGKNKSLLKVSPAKKTREGRRAADSATRGVRDTKGRNVWRWKRGEGIGQRKVNRRSGPAKEVRFETASRRAGKALVKNKR